MLVVSREPWACGVLLKLESRGAGWMKAALGIIKQVMIQYCVHMLRQTRGQIRWMQERHTYVWLVSSTDYLSMLAHKKDEAMGILTLRKGG